MKDNNLESRYHEAEKITSLKQMLGSLTVN